MAAAEREIIPFSAAAIVKTTEKIPIIRVFSP